MSGRQSSHSSTAASTATSRNGSVAHEPLPSLLAIPHVQFAAIWQLQQSSPVPAVRILQSGTVSKELPAQLIQQCLENAVRQPGQPLLMGDREFQDRQSTKAVIAVWAFNKNFSQDEYSVLEIRYEPETSLVAARESLLEATVQIEQDLKRGHLAQKVRYVSPQQPAPNITPPIGPSGMGEPCCSVPEGNTGKHDSEIDGATAPHKSSESWTALARNLHQSLDPEQTDLHVCNELQSFLDVDRVTVLRKLRGSWRIQAISGQSAVNRRSPWVQQIEALAQSVLPTGESLEFPTEAILPSPIRIPLDDYLVKNDVRCLKMLPVFERAVELESQTAAPKQPTESPRPIAAILLESLTQDHFRDREALEASCLVAGDAIRVSHQHRQLLFYPLWHRLGQARVTAWSRRLPVLWILVALIVAIGCLCFWPARFYVTAQGTLIPLRRHRIYAPHNGIIEEIYVRPHQTVSVGMPLARMRDYQLESQIHQVQREQVLVEEKLRLGNRRIRTDEARQRFTNREGDLPLGVLEQELAHLSKQQSLLEKQKQELLITSPMKGQILTWQVDDRLLQRPVPFGRLLMEIADTEGPWKLELNLPNRRIGHLLTAMKNADGERLKVEFVLAAKPDRRFYGTLSNVASTVAVSREDGAFVKLEVEIEDSELQLLQNETEVTAKVFCDQSVLGHVWLHDLGEFLQKQVFFYTW